MSRPTNSNEANSWLQLTPSPSLKEEELDRRIQALDEREKAIASREEALAATTKKLKEYAATLKARFTAVEAGPTHTTASETEDLSKSNRERGGDKGLTMEDIAFVQKLVGEGLTAKGLAKSMDEGTRKSEEEDDGEEYGVAAEAGGKVEDENDEDDDGRVGIQRRYGGLQLRCGDAPIWVRK